MIKNDMVEKDRVDDRNALEEYVYEIRGKLQEDGELEKYVAEPIRESICKQLEKLENWLYEEGEHCSGAEYKKNLEDLHQQTDPIKARQFEFSGQKNAFEQFCQAIQQAEKAIMAITNKDPKYDHLTNVELMNIEEQLNKSKKYQETTFAKLGKAKKTEDPPIKLNEIAHEEHTLRSCVNSVINRAKPRPATPPPAPAKEDGAKEEPQQEQPQQQENEKMDLD